MSYLPSSLAGGRRARNQPRQAAIIETNAARYERPIVWRCRWLDGWLGMYAQTNWMLNDGVGLAKYAAPSELQMHWALRIGPYLYELTTDEHMGISWRYVDETRWESWKSATPDRVVGETCATDNELAQMAEEVISQMQCRDPVSSSPPAKYNFVRNNCHTFALRLLENTINLDVGAVDMRAFAGFDSGTVGTSASPALAGWRKMNAVSSHHSVPELWGSPSAYFRAVSDMAKGKLRERHFEGLLPDYRRGAVSEERTSRQALIAAVYAPTG